MFRLYFLAAFVVSCHGIQLTKYQICGGATSTIHSFEFTPCTVEPCVVHPLVTYTAHINFTATENSHEAHTTLDGHFNGPLGIQPFPNITANACGNGLKCPVHKGLATVYTASVTVPQTTSARLAAQWEVKNENSNYILCVVFPITLQEN